MQQRLKKHKVRTHAGLAMPTWRGATALFVLMLAVFIMAGGRAGAVEDAFDAKTDKFLKDDVKTKSPFTTVPIIVQLSPSMPVSAVNSLGGATVTGRLPMINSVTMTVPIGLVTKLAKLAHVTHISEDVEVGKYDEFTVGSSGADIAFSQYGLTGSGVGVAVLDSGVRSRPDLNASSGGSRILASVSFVPNDPSTDDACGHGTHVAGIIAGNGSSSSGNNCFRTFYGIGRSTNIVNVRVLGPNGSSTVSTVISGIQWVINHRSQYNIRVMNISLGHIPGDSYQNDPLCQACEAAYRNGIVVVCAAGNLGRVNASPSAGMDNEGYGTAYGSIVSPGNDPYVITVGAMKSIDGYKANDRIATYSSRGPSRIDFVLKPDLVAPGNRVIALRCPNSYLDQQYASTNLLPFSYYRNTSSSADTPEYFYLSGTSMSAPVVSGAVALMLQADPTLSPDTVKARLMVSADKLVSPQGNPDLCSYGAGYLDIPAALACSIVATQPTLSPTLLRDANGNVYFDSAIWGSHAIWGTGVTNLNAVWGSNAISGSNAVWGSNALWGANAVWGSNALWGSSAIWGTGVWSDSAIWGTSGGGDVQISSVYGEN